MVIRMDNQKMSGRQMKYVIALFLIGSSLVGGTASKAGQDSWICMLLATVAVVPMIFVYNSILRLYPGENLFDIVIKIFGNIVGKIICIIYTFYAIHLGSLVLNIFGEFIHIVNMPETPKVLIVCAMMLVCIYMVYKGLSNIGRVSKFLFPILVVLFLMTVVLSLKDMNFNNIKPILTTEMKTLLNSSLTVFSLPLGEMVLFMTLFSSIDPKENFKKIYIYGLIFAMLVLVGANLRNLLILGPTLVKIFPFASYESVSIIAIGDFFTRIEVIIGIDLLIAGFIKICVCCFSSAIGVARIFNISEYKYVVVPCVLIMITLTGFSFKNTVEMMDFVDIIKFYAVPFQVILPIIILVTAKIKSKIMSKLMKTVETTCDMDKA